MVDGEYKLLTPQQAAQHFNVSISTLKRWEEDGAIETSRVGNRPGSHRRYKVQLSSPSARESKQQQCICYARVSSSAQKEDLERQVNSLRLQYPTHRIIQDIGSGLNFKRKGLLAILDIAVHGGVQELVVTHKDRLCRFGFELFEHIVRSASNGKIVVLNSDPQTSPTEELAEDVLSILTVFTSRLHGRRGGRHNKNTKQPKQRPRQGENEDHEVQAISD